MAHRLSFRTDLRSRAREIEAKIFGHRQCDSRMRVRVVGGSAQQRSRHVGHYPNASKRRRFSCSGPSCVCPRQYPRRKHAAPPRARSSRIKSGGASCCSHGPWSPRRCAGETCFEARATGRLRRRSYAGNPVSGDALFNRDGRADGRSTCSEWKRRHLSRHGDDPACE